MFNMFFYLTFPASIVHELYICLVILHLLLVQYISCVFVYLYYTCCWYIASVVCMFNDLTFAAGTVCELLLIYMFRELVSHTMIALSSDSFIQIQSVSVETKTKTNMNYCNVISYVEVIYQRKPTQSE